jgi:amidase
VGPITRTVKDAAYVLSVIASPSNFDNVSWPEPFDTAPDYL